MIVLAGIALLLAIGIIALMYIASYLFDQPQLRGIAQDEVVHLLATGVVLLGIVGLAQALDDVYFPKLVGAAGGNAGGQGLHLQAMSALNGIDGVLGSTLGSLKSLNENLGKEASRSSYCNFLGAGYSLVSCSTLNMLRSTLVQAMMVTGAAIADITAQRMLVKAAQLYAFELLLPIGLFLYAFKFTRGGGAALIAIAVGFYAVYPLSVLFSENMLVGQIRSGVGGHAAWVNAPSIPTGVSCDSRNPSWGQINDVRESMAGANMFEAIIFQSLVRAILCSIINLMITLAFIRAFALLLGSEIDVSALARIS